MHGGRNVGYLSLGMLWTQLESDSVTMMSEPASFNRKDSYCFGKSVGGGMRSLSIPR